MKTIHMGLNTEPYWLRADEIIRRWQAEGDTKMVELWENSKKKSLELNRQIIEAVERDGEVQLSWGCTGRTLHEILAHQWADAMPAYDFEIGYNYHCVVRTKKRA